MKIRAAIVIGGLACMVAGALAVGASGAGPTPQCFGEPATIVKGAGDNEIQGTSGPDVIVAGAGNDDIFAGAGEDLVCGGAGIDLVAGQEDGDMLDGETGGDAVVGEGGDDLVRGGPGRDSGQAVTALVLGVNGGAGEDRLRGGGGKDELVSNDLDEPDDFNGGARTDTCDVGAGDTHKSCEVLQ